MNVNSDLIQAYSSARYVICSDPLITLRVNEVSVELANLMITKAFCKAAFITAFNPFREILSADENDLRHKLLVEKINRLGICQEFHFHFWHLFRRLTMRENLSKMISGQVGRRLSMPFGNDAMGQNSLRIHRM